MSDFFSSVAIGEKFIVVLASKGGVGWGATANKSVATAYTRHAPIFEKVDNDTAKNIKSEKIMPFEKTTEVRLLDFPE